MVDFISRIITDPNWVAAYAQILAAVVTAVSVIILVRQVIKTDEQIRKTEEHVREAAIRSRWDLLHAERQRLEADVTQIDTQIGGSRRESRRSTLSRRIAEVSDQMRRLEDKYPDAFRY